MYYHVRNKDLFPLAKITFEALSFERITSRYLYGTKNLTIEERFEENTALITVETRYDVSTRSFGQLLKQHFET